MEKPTTFDLEATTLDVSSNQNSTRPVTGSPPNESLLPPQEIIRADSAPPNARLKGSASADSHARSTKESAISPLLNAQPTMESTASAPSNVSRTKGSASSALPNAQPTQGAESANARGTGANTFAHTS